MYAVSTSDEGDCYLCLPPDPGGEAAALGACEAAALGASASAAPGAGESALSGTASAQVFHTFTLDSGASRSFFRDCTTLTPLSRPVAVSLADPSGGPVLASFYTVLPCPAAPSGTLSGLYLPSFSTNLVATSSQVFAAASRLGPESAPCSCRLLSHQTLLWHHRLGHPSLPRLRGMASRVLVSGLPRSLPPLTPGPAPTCVPCVEGRQRAAPYSSEFPPTEAPLQTLHMDVWGPARIRGQCHERYFLLVVDDYSRYTTVFPLRSKGDVTETFTLLASPQKNGIVERRIGMVMDVARTSMIYAAAPHLLWLFAVGDASAFRVWGSRAFVRDLSVDKLSPCAVPCVFLGFPPDAPGWQFYHPTSRHVLSSQGVTFDESVPYYRLFPYRTAPLPPPPLFLAPGPPPPVEVAVDSGAARGAEPVGARSGGAESRGAEPGGAESGGAEPGGAASGGAESGGSTTQEFKLFHGKGGRYIGNAVFKNSVFVLDFVPDQGTADSDAIVNFASWTHPPDLDPDFSLGGFWYSHTIPEAKRTRALATIRQEVITSTAAETTSSAAETTSATTATPTAPIVGSSTAPVLIDDTPPTPAQQLTPTPRKVL
ncbi:unnamed protein product [Closterium sp. NIES-54]